MGFHADAGYPMKSRLVLVSIGMLGAVFVSLFASPAQAQRRAGFASARAGRSGVGISRGRGPRTSFLSGRRGRRFTDEGFTPYFYSDYDGYSDYDYEPDVIEPPSPETIVEQAVRPAPRAPTPSEPLVLELQGDHWVRITNYGQSQTGAESSELGSKGAPSLPSAISSATSRRTEAAEPSSELPPAVLVFRDGHQEEIAKYLITGGNLYTSADYWSGGSWTRKVQIAELDVPATLRLNRERGANFSLPSGPNEVMIRP